MKAVGKAPPNLCYIIVSTNWLLSSHSQEKNLQNIFYTDVELQWAFGIKTYTVCDSCMDGYTMSDAKDICASLQQELLIPESDEELNFVLRIMA